jgi:Lrp/AsnC family transcriptional regulator, leucine-responsive regulatory protein
MSQVYAVLAREATHGSVSFRSMTTIERLTEIDRKILALLQQEGRRSFADIGREVGLSTPAVKRRVDRLEAAGVIRGYTAIVDASKLGFGFEAIAELYCADRTAPRDLLKSVAGIPEVVSAVTVSGEPDAVLRVQVDDIRHLERLIETLRRRPNVVRTRTMIVLSVLVDRPSAMPE